MGHQREISGSQTSRVGDEVGGRRRAYGEEPDDSRRVPARLGDMGTVELPQGHGADVDGIGQASVFAASGVVPFRPLLLTVEEAAELLRISRAHIYEYILAGRIRSVKLGRSGRIPPSALEEFVVELTAEQRDAPSEQW